MCLGCLTWLSLGWASDRTGSSLGGGAVTSAQREKLIEARALIEAGWVKGYSWNRARTKFCAVGACTFVGTVTRPLRRVLEAIYGPVDMYPSSFNDDPTTTHDDVLGLFDLAIAGVGQ